MRDLDGSLTAQGVEGMKPDALPLESGLFTLDSESVSLDSLCGTWKLYNGPIPLKKAFRQTLTDASFVAALSDSGLRLDGCAKVKVPFRQVQPHSRQWRGGGDTVAVGGGGVHLALCGIGEVDAPSGCA